MKRSALQAKWARGSPRTAKRARTGGDGFRAPAPRRSQLASMATEVKFLDTSLAVTALALGTTSVNGEKDPVTLLSLSAMPQGDGPSNRDGRRVRLTHVEVKGVIIEDERAATGLDPPQNYFVALVLDRQTNGAQLNSEDVFTNQGAIDALGTSPFADLNFGKRFKVLASRVMKRTDLDISFVSATNNEHTGVLTPFHFNVPLNIPVMHSLTTGVVAACVDNSLHMIAWALEIAVSAPKIAYNARVRFVG